MACGAGWGSHTCGTCFASVLPREKVLEQVAHELEGDVFGRQRRAVEELEEVVVITQMD